VEEPFTRRWQGDDPSVLVAAGVHGNETGGVKAINRFLDGEFDFNRDNPVKVLEGEPEYEVSGDLTLMVANPGAVEMNRRSVDEDLVEVMKNGGKGYEGELAEHIDQIAPDMDYILDLHGSENVGGEPVTVMNPQMGGGRSAADPHVVMYDFNPETVQLAELTGLEEVRDYNNSSHDDRAGFFRYSEPTVVATETGPRGRRESAETSYEIMLNVLGGLGVIDYEPESSEPEVYGPGNGGLRDYAGLD
jgi:predicted deacylase